MSVSHAKTEEKKKAEEAKKRKEQMNNWIITQIVTVIIMIAGIGVLVYKTGQLPIPYLLGGLGIGVIVGLTRYFAAIKHKDIMMETWTLEQAKKELKSTQMGKRYNIAYWGAIFALIMIFFTVPGVEFVNLVIAYFAINLVNEAIFLKYSYNLRQWKKDRELRSTMERLGRR